MSDNYAACPNHEGHWWHKSTGACSCGASHSLLDRLLEAGTTMTKWCPYPACDFSGTDAEVDDHRAENHRGEAQQGSNLSSRPRF